LDINLSDRLANRDGQLQLHGLPDGLLLVAGDVRSHRFRHSLHCLGGDLQIGQQFHLLTTVIEAGALTAHQRQHAAHSRRKLGIFDVSGDIGGEVSLTAVRAPVAGTEHAGRTQHGEDGFAPRAFITGMVTAGARHVGGNRSGLVEEFAQTGCAGGVECGSQGQLPGLQVQAAGFSLFRENAWQQSV